MRRTFNKNFLNINLVFMGFGTARLRVNRVAGL
jgi:hypothetical protein